MQLLIDNWKFICGGIGAIGVALLGAWLKYKFDKKLAKEKLHDVPNTPTQNVVAGNNSKVVQVGGDLTISKK